MMCRATIITGTPGTGKTTLTKLLEKEGYSVLEVGKVVKEEELYDFFDENMKSYVVDDSKLNDYLIQKIKNHSADLPLIIEGHVARLPPAYVSHCIVLRCSVLNLRQRLVVRDYAEPKIDENVEAEIMEIILTDMLHLYGEENVTVVSTDGAIEDSFERLMSVLRAK
ncbi:MAG: AAA family ATPase [Candidatus Heimdallarchaeota archaeon]|nr:AAA family ATPase [Candidatus Heimdallarchaeota archaeon]